MYRNRKYEQYIFYQRYFGKSQPPKTIQFCVSTRTQTLQNQTSLTSQSTLITTGRYNILSS